MTKHILTVTILLLTITTHLSAQARDSSQTLEGLRDIGLIVKYGRADGLELAKQPATLQKLQDRAKDLLKEGAVPLLQSTNEADMVGRPHLVFTVTMKNESDIPPAIEIEGRLYQRVRLLHDPAKEVELATWTGGSIGSKVTFQNVLALFEQNVKVFVTDYRAANPKSSPAESRTAEPPPQLRYNADALQGLNGVRLVVSLSSIQFEEAGRMVEVDPRFKGPEFSKILNTEAERRFKQAGIPLLRNDIERAGSPLLFVSVTLCQPNLHSPGVAVRSTLWQWVSLARDPRKETSAVTWASGANEGWPITEKAVLQVLNSQLDEFIKAYTASNPNLSSLPKVTQ